MTRTLQIRSPSRLHFGLLSFGNEPHPQFGGAGAMIGPPYLEATLCEHQQLQAVGPHADRVTEFARRWSQFHGRDQLPNCQIEVTSAPPVHVGLGSGTQLAMSVALLLSEFHQLPRQSALELAQSVGRGKRSAVGTHGFVSGGLIVERGKRVNAAIGELDCRIELPETWRFLLVRPDLPAGLSGNQEHSAFSNLPSVDRSTRDSLITELRERLLPAAARRDFEAFSESLYRYGHAAGECFAPAQGGPYNGPLLMRLVETIRRLGVSGVGQSSWGPTLFAVVPSDTAAAELAEQLRSQEADLPLHLEVAQPDNHGARLTA